MGEPFYTKAAGATSADGPSVFWSRMSMKRPKWLRLVNRRVIWCPTWLGMFCIGAVLVSPMAWWFLWGESFLAATCRIPAEVLVVEGWIGPEGVRAACAEFWQHGYRYVIASGGVTGERWEPDRWGYADVAERELLRSGIPRDQVIVAPAGDVRSRRTYQSAVAVRQALEARGIKPQGVDVFTLGPHGARSRLVFAKVFHGGTKVGVIDWTPSDNDPGPWWRSSERSREMISETAGYLFELLLNSGRSSNMNEHSIGAGQARTLPASANLTASCRPESKPGGGPGLGIPAGMRRNSLDSSRRQPLRHQGTNEG